MHMAWVRQICGRLRKDFRYSNEIVYNNFPWPPAPTAAQVVEVEKRSSDVLEERQKAGVPLATLYNPLLIPGSLVQAHERFDLAMEGCYRPRPFRSDLARLRRLFALYAKIVPSDSTLDTWVADKSVEEDTDC